MLMTWRYGRLANKCQECRCAGRITPGLWRGEMGDLQGRITPGLWRGSMGDLQIMLRARWRRMRHSGFHTYRFAPVLDTHKMHDIIYRKRADCFDHPRNAQGLHPSASSGLGLKAHFERESCDICSTTTCCWLLE